MSRSEIEQHLKSTIGLDATTVGTATIGRAIAQRIDVCGVHSESEYWSLLRKKPDELQALIERVVVPETWFFRYPEAFRMLAGECHKHLRTQPKGHLHLLSLPCSTGEEPYSIAMTMLDAGISPSQFTIDAVDISASALQTAKAGCYGINAFRGQNIRYRERYFTGVEQGFQIIEKVRQCVKFRQGNLLQASNFLGIACYDVVFCRNVLIYLDHHDKNTTLNQLARILKPEGLLFVGSSEPGRIQSPHFESARRPHAFAFYRREARSDKTSIAMPTSHAPAKPHAIPRPLLPARLSPLKPPIEKSSQLLAPQLFAPQLLTPVDLPETEFKETGEPATEYQEVLRLANQGQLEAAKALYTKIEARMPPSAAGFYLAGLLEDAQHNPEKAVYYYRKALYLDPDHHESLLHLAYLQETRGDRMGAQRLKERAKRVQARKPK